MPISTSWPTPLWSSVANGSAGQISSASLVYSGRNLPASSRLTPSVICVRSLVPKLKNSATSAISSAVSAARGISIMVPTR